MYHTVGDLGEHLIPFHISGGFAANIHGSNRPLSDIEIPYEKIFESIDYVRKFTIDGQERYKDKESDLLLMTLKYKGQEKEY